MSHGSHTAPVDAVRSYLTEPGRSDLVVADLREFTHTFAQAERDTDTAPDIEVRSLKVVHVAAGQATVEAKCKVTPKPGSEPAAATEQELRVSLIDDAGWKIADVSSEGVRLSSRIRDVRVEPAAAEGIGVRACGLRYPSGETLVAISLRNGTDRPWRLQCAAVDSRRGRLRLLAQISRKKLRSANAGIVDYDPGSEHAVLFRMQPNTDRLWIKARQQRSMRTLIFAVSSEAEEPAASEPAAFASPRKGLRAGVLMRKVILPLGVVAALGALTGGATSAVGFAVFVLACYLLGVVSRDLCVRRLERKLARLRAATLS